MLRLAALTALLSLSACAGGPGTCTNPFSRDLRILDRLIAETETNIDRGYALGQPDAVRGAVNLCVGTARTNVGVSFCTDGTGVRNSAPIAIDLIAERRKLAGLQERRAALAARGDAAIATCRAGAVQ